MEVCFLFSLSPENVNFVSAVPAQGIHSWAPHIFNICSKLQDFTMVFLVYSCNAIAHSSCGIDVFVLPNC